MNIEDLTIKQARELAAIFCGWNTGNNHPYHVGKVYFIRTVTMIQVGRLVAVTPQELVLEDAAWVAETGRFTQALETCNFSEVELFPAGEVLVGRGAIIDAGVLPASFERKQK